MKRIIFLFSILCLLITTTSSFAQQHDRHWMGTSHFFFNGVHYGPVLMGFEEDNISYQELQPPFDTIGIYESIAMSDANGALQFYTNGNVVVSWNGHIMEGGKGFNEGSPASDFGWGADTVDNTAYVGYTYQLIPDGYEEGVYYMLHSFLTSANLDPCTIEFSSSKMQMSKIDMNANGGLGKIVYKNRYINEELMGAAFAIVQHGNGHDWWLVQRSPYGLDFRSTLLQRDTVLFTVESTMPGLSADWFDCEDFWASAHNLLDVSPDGSLLLDNYGFGYAKLMAFDRCSGEVSLIDTFSTGTTQLEFMGNQICDACTVGSFAFSPSGRYLYGVGYAEYVQYDLWADDLTASKVQLGGVPWGMDDLQNVIDVDGVRIVGGFGTFSLGPDGKLYNLWETMHTVFEYPDEQGEASGYCIAADNAPISCLEQDVGYYLFSTPHPHYRMGALTGSGCDTIVSSTVSPLPGSGYGLKASPSVASGQVEVSITLPSYGSHVTAELQVVDMLGRVVHRHRFPPYAYLHSFEVSEWTAGLYNLVLMENGRAKAGARVVVGR